MKPSNNWTSTLIKLIQECPSETGDSFTQFFWELLSNISDDEKAGYSNDQELIKALKEML